MNEKKIVQANAFFVASAHLLYNIISSFVINSLSFLQISSSLEMKIFALAN